MKIVHIIPGSGGTFYCENCLRDTALVRALRARGHDVLMVPLYLPMFVDDPGIPGDVPVFFGGINVYLQQKFALFRKTPRWLDRVFDMPWMLQQAAARESSTNAADLGPMTLSMLRGGHGNQYKELRRLVYWLEEHERPDVVHISNALLLGMAGEIKHALKTPVVCSLQDEDTWLDAMRAPYDKECWQAMSEAGRGVDAYVAVSRWYAGQMERRMGISPEKMNVIPLGIEIDAGEKPVRWPEVPVIGYLSRLCPTQGLDRLVEAFLTLKKRPEFSDLKLRATGGISPANRIVLRDIDARLRKEGVAGDVEFIGDFHKEQRHEFIKSLSVLSVPVPSGEAFGTFILEALAYGVPVVQPAVGAFPEVVEATGGGIIYNPAEAGAYESALALLLGDPARAAALGARGREAVRERFSIGVMADRLEQLYARVVAGARR